VRRRGIRKVGGGYGPRKKRRGDKTKFHEKTQWGGLGDLGGNERNSRFSLSGKTPGLVVSSIVGGWGERSRRGEHLSEGRKSGHRNSIGFV